MRVEIIQHHPDDFSFGVTRCQMLHAMGKVDFGAALHDQDITPALLGFAHHHQIAHPHALIFDIISGRFARPHWDGVTYLGNELFRAFIEADDGTHRIENGAEALALAQKNTYDLILMDMQMPKLNGIDATRAIRKLPGYAETPILAMTANAFVEDRRRCIEAGMNDHIGKPVDPKKLFEVLLKWLARGK